MKATVQGQITKPAIVVVGAWDPMVATHHELFEQIGCQARRNGLSSLVVVIDPDPALVMRGRAKWPVYDDLHTRIHYIRSAGVDAVLHLHFSKHGLEAGAAEFFAVLQEHAVARELWLGAHQSLGRGPAGSGNAIIELAEERGIAVQRLPIVRYTPSPYETRQALLAGKIADVAKEMGRPPIRRRPDSGTLRLAWAPGRYWAVPLSSPTQPPSGTPIALDVRRMETGLRMPRLVWPDPAIRYLAFLAGPADEHEAVDQVLAEHIA